MRWITRLDEAPAGAEGTVVWTASPETEGARPEPEDLADAASLGVEAGAARLRRRTLLRALAGRMLACAPAEIRFTREGGRPRVIAPTPLAASAAGRDGWSVVVLSSAAVGVDIERIAAEGAAPLDLLAPEERTRLASLPTAHQAEAFARLWAAKEAWAKATETPLQTALARPLCEAVETRRVGVWIVAAWEARG